MSARPMQRWSAAAASLCVAYLIAAFLWILWPASAEQFTPYDEIRKKSQVFNSTPSFDTTPITVKVVDVVYSIPRNYLVLVEPAIPTLRVTFPGFKPLTEETRDCFDPKWQVNNPGKCISIQFLLLGSRGPGPKGHELTNSEKFANFKKHNAPARLRKGPFGYDIYETGPQEARGETYRKEAGDIYFHCTFFGEQHRTKKVGSCNNMFRLDDMNHAQFFFRLAFIEHIPEIENGIRRLMAGFVIQVGNHDFDSPEPNDSKRD